jgi:type I restriction enzyme R subunit
MNEAETRAEHIDPALAAAGWGVVSDSRIRREYSITLGRIEGHGKRGKALIADYVLEYRNTKLAVIEAKAWDKPLTKGVGQAKDYAGKLSIRFAYATNGQGIYAIDMHTGAEGKAARYPTPSELGAAPSPSKTHGATASPPCRSRTAAAISKAATTKTSPSSGYWGRFPKGASASC